MFYLIFLFFFFFFMVREKYIKKNRIVVNHFILRLEKKKNRIEEIQSLIFKTILAFPHLSNLH